MIGPGLADHVPFQAFLRVLERVHDLGLRERDFVQVAEPAMKLLLQSGDFLPPGAMESCADHYARHLLYRDPKGRFVVAAMVWQPGQGTPIHDHDGSWGLLGLVQGSLRVVNYHSETDEVSPGVVPLTPDPPYLPCAGGKESVCGCADVHQVTNLGEELAVSVHVYARDIDQCLVFEPCAQGSGQFQARVMDLCYDA
jgi:predicted metal-dependent enzyme (double-stranded beta helix superfamily)